MLVTQTVPGKQPLCGALQELRVIMEESLHFQRGSIFLKNLEHFEAHGLWGSGYFAELKNALNRQGKDIHDCLERKSNLWERHYSGENTVGGWSRRQYYGPAWVPELITPIWWTCGTWLLEEDCAEIWFLNAPRGLLILISFISWKMLESSLRPYNHTVTPGKYLPGHAGKYAEGCNDMCMLEERIERTDFSTTHPAQGANWWEAYLRVLSNENNQQIDSTDTWRWI